MRAVPVSYTHLDVYKRQPEGLPYHAVWPAYRYPGGAAGADPRQEITYNLRFVLLTNRRFPFMIRALV